MARKSVFQRNKQAMTIIRETPVETVRKLAAAGEEAGLSFEDLVSFLRAGLSIEELLDAIESGLIQSEPYRGRIM
jgi:hypothetical protein